MPHASAPKKQSTREWVEHSETGRDGNRRSRETYLLGSGVIVRHRDGDSTRVQRGKDQLHVIDRE